MNTCERLIRGICENDIEIKAEIRFLFYKTIRDFVEKNNELNHADIRTRYIYDDAVGMLNLRFTSKLNNQKIVDRVNGYDFEHVIYFIAKYLYISEFRINPKQSKLNGSLNVEDTIQFDESKYLSEFKEVISIRERELTLLRRLMYHNSYNEFRDAYFDLAIDIVNKWRNRTANLNEMDLQEYAKDIFSEALLKLVTLVQQNKYVYEAKISSFLYWPMFNRWAKMSKELGVEINDHIINNLPDDQKIYFETSLEKEEIRSFIRDNLGELNERERQILWMKEAEGFSYQEIKTKLNLDEEINYLKQIKLRGKRNLKNIIKEDRRYRELL